MWSRRTKRTYLDVAAGVSANPSSPHTEGRLAREELEHARVAIARLVEAKPDDVIFTGGATEANALAILGVVHASRRAGVTRPHLLYNSGSHASIVGNMRIAEREGAVLEPLPIKDCRIDCRALAKMLRPETALVSLEAVCGETGVVWNTREVARVLMTARQGVPPATPSALVPGRYMPGPFAGPYLQVDASQAVWTEKLIRSHFGADLLVFDSSKVCKARGIGALVAPRTIPIAPLYAGGGQERGLVPGSEASALAAVFAEGLVHASRNPEKFRKHAQMLRRELIARIRASVPDVLVNEGRTQAPHILNLSLPGRDTDYLVALLDEAGYAISTVSACESASGEPSRAVLALFGDRERAASTLRVSWGPATSTHELDRFVTALIHAVRFVDSSTSA